MRPLPLGSATVPVLQASLCMEPQSQECQPKGAKEPLQQSHQEPEDENLIDISSS